MSEEYGYRDRPPMPDRFVAGGVASPRNQWPNRLLKDWRESGSSGSGDYTQTLLKAVRPDGFDLLGHASPTMSTLGRGYTSVVVTSNGWASEFNRHGYLVDVTGASPGNGIYLSAANFNFQPRAYLDPDQPPVPCVIRCEDVIAAMTTTAQASHKGGYGFGLSWENNNPPLSSSPYPWVGFQTTWDNPDTYGEWNAWISNAAGTVMYSAALGVYSNVPHHLAFEMDGVTKQIGWYVDDVLLDSYAVESGDIFHTIIAFAISLRWSTQCNVLNHIVRSVQMCDYAAAVSVRIYDLDTV